MSNALADRKEVAAFYDGFRDRLISDYYDGSPRVDAALEFAKAALAGVQDVLDVGCGIGWTSAEMAASGARVVGIDISPELIITARHMFGERCEFIEGDFLEAAIEGRFDGILMVDVYEHFPRESRPLLHEQIDKALGERLVLTVPTPEALDYARDNDIPLQIIDEDVTEADIEQLARYLGATIEVNHIVTIYRPSDYRHVLISR